MGKSINKLKRKKVNKSIKKKRTRKMNSKMNSKIDRKGGIVLGKFYALNEDSNGFSPLYLTIRNVNNTILSWSCPPENYPKPHYIIRGMQQDELPPFILNNEIEINEMTKRGGNVYLTDGYYKIKLTNSWIKSNMELWESILYNYDL